MTRVRWQSNNHEGRCLRRGIDKAVKFLEESDEPMVIASLLNSISAAARVKAALAKDSELEERIQALEEVAALAQRSRVMT